MAKRIALPLRWHGLFPRGGWVRAERALLDLVFPPQCTSCGAETSPAQHGQPQLCAACRRRLVQGAVDYCPACGVFPRPAGACLTCRAGNFGFSAVVPLAPYDGFLRSALLRAKSRHHEALSVALGHVLADVRGPELQSAGATVVVPVPMFWRRRLGRGVNSAELLAESLADCLNLACRRVLARRRNTLPQGDLGARARRRNVRGAFAPRRGCRLAGARVLLIDDVMTTGATCNEATRTLLEAGAARVVVATVARTILPSVSR